MGERVDDNPTSLVLGQTEFPAVSTMFFCELFLYILSSTNTHGHVDGFPIETKSNTEMAVDG